MQEIENSQNNLFFFFKSKLERRVILTSRPTTEGGHGGQHL
jgi:hypothetical protein